jgi:hypothetical protein
MHVYIPFRLILCMYCVREPHYRRYIIEYITAMTTYILLRTNGGVGGLLLVGTGLGFPRLLYIYTTHY